MGLKPRVGPAGSFEREFGRRRAQLAEEIDDEATEHLLCHADRYDDAGLSLSDRAWDVVAFAWGWFCGAADARGLRRGELWTQLTGRRAEATGTRARPEPRHELEPTFAETWEFLLDALGDEELAEHLLVEFPRDTGEAATATDDPDRHDVEWAWGWFCGAADGLGKSRRALFGRLRAACRD